MTGNVGKYTRAELDNLCWHTAKKHAIVMGIPRAAHPCQRDIKNSPRCKTPGCKNTKTPLEWHWTSGKPIYRPVCQPCHEKRTVSNYVKKYSTATWIKDISGICAHKAGFGSVSEHIDARARVQGFKGRYDQLDHQAQEKGFRGHAHRLNSKHPYRQYRKEYCENRDGRLGFTCAFTKPKTGMTDGMLQVDHIVPQSVAKSQGWDQDKINSKKNLQTLCCNCHNYKTHNFNKFKECNILKKQIESST